jgi:hypothetical protein
MKTIESPSSGALKKTYKKILKEVFNMCPNFFVSNLASFLILISGL